METGIGKVEKCTVANWKICLATKREYKSTCRSKKRQHVDSMSQHTDKLRSENSKSVWTLINNRKHHWKYRKINMNLKVWYEYSKSLHSAMYVLTSPGNDIYNFVDSAVGQ